MGSNAQDLELDDDLERKIKESVLLSENQEIVDEDKFVQGISKMFDVEPNQVMGVLRSSEKDDDALKRYKLAELAGAFKRDYSMNNYPKNAELIKKYGRKDLLSLAEFAKEEKVDFYGVEEIANRLELTEIDDIKQIMPHYHGSKKLLGTVGKNTATFKTYDAEGEMHIFIYDNSDAELSIKLNDYIKSKEETDDLLGKENIGQETRYKIFHLIKDKLTPTDNLDDSENSKHNLSIQTADKDVFNQTTDENALNANYRDNPMEKVQGGVDIQGPKEEQELDFNH